jgi:hypothetical protein
MSTIALSGNDTLIINDRVINDFADNDCAMLSFPNDIASVKTGKNGNSIYGLNTSGQQAELVLRLIRGSADDKFFNNLQTQQLQNFAGFVLMIGEFIKKLGDGAGNISSDTYVVSGGVFTKQVPAKSNVEGDTEQSVAVYTLKFSNAPRVIT